MKILFICPSLEAGRDGVGDYCRRLAGELLAQGVQVSCLALSDRALGVPLSISPEVQISGDQLVETWRWGAHYSWKERMDYTQKVLDLVKPDWISLHFVPYGYQEKGLPWRLPRRLANLRGDFRWHVMFHELWIGGSPTAPFRQRVIGWLQRKIVRELGKKLRPQVITSNEKYRSQLAEVGIPAEVVPLFSNLPFASPDTSLRAQLLERSFPARTGRFWIFIFFGTLFPEWPPEPLLSRIEVARGRCEIAGCLFLGLGQLGGQGERIWQSMAASENPCFQFERKAGLEIDLLSQHMQVGDFGVAAAPWELIGKSSSSATLREHGLPIIVNRVEEKTPSPSDPFWILLNEDFERRLSTARKSAPATRLPDIAKILAESLSEAKK